MIKHLHRRGKRLLLLCGTLFCMAEAVNAQSPAFTRTDTSAIIYCHNAGAIDLNKLLTGTDPDVGQTLTWRISQAPAHGTLIGFPYSATSNGNAVTPAGLTFTPTAGYSGEDFFSVTLGDGSTANFLTVRLRALAGPAIGTITGRTLICETNMAALTCTPAGGTWASSNTSAATINASNGVVQSLFAGSSTITYSVSDGTCTNTASTLFTVLPYPEPSQISGNSTACIGTNLQLGNTLAGGTWSSRDATIASVDANGLVTAHAAGTVDIDYTVTNGTCRASVSKTITIAAAPVYAPITGDSSICLGTTTQLANTNTGGTWISDNPAIASVNSTGLVTAAGSGKTIIKYQFGSSGCYDTALTSIYVTAAGPIAPIMGDTALCLGSRAQFTNTTPGGTWSTIDVSGGGRVTVNATKGTVYGSLAGIATVYYTTGTGACSSTASFTVKVKEPPIKFGSFNWRGYFCEGSTMQSSTSSPAGGVWGSSDTTIATVDPVTGRATGLKPGFFSVTYGYTFPDNYCLSRNTLETEVVAIQKEIPGRPTNNTLCVGETLNSLTQGSNYTKILYGDSTLAPLQANGYFLAQKPGATTYSFIYENKACQTSLSGTLIIKAVPELGTLSGTDTVCQGKTAVLSDLLTGGKWYSSNSSVAAIDSTKGTITGLTAGTTIITHIYSNGTCADTSGKSIIVKALAGWQPVTGTTRICSGNTTQLSCAIGGGRWSSSDTAVATISNTGLATSKKGGTVTITYTYGNGSCTDTTTARITVDAQPAQAAIIGTGNVCTGNTIQLAATVGTGVWKTTDTYFTISNYGIVTPLKAGTGTAMYIYGNNSCVDTATLPVTVNTTPAISVIKGAYFLCAGTQTTYTDSIKGGTWSSSNPSVLAIDSAGVATGKVAGNATISYTITNGSCSNSVSQSVTVGAVPSAGTITGVAAICAGTTLQLSNTSTPGYWSVDNTKLASIGSTTGLLRGSAAGKVTVTYMAYNSSCSATTTAIVTINALPDTPVIATNGKNNFCVGKDSAVLTAPAAASYQWFNYGSTINGATGKSYTSLYSGNFSVQITDNNGCSTKSDATVISVKSLPTVNSIGGDSVFCLSYPYKLNGNPKPGVWSISNKAVATIDSNGIITTIAPGTAVVTYTVSNGYCSNSITKNVAVRALPQIQPITGDTAICTNGSAQLATATAGGTWYSSDTIGRVSNTGLVTGYGTKGGIMTVNYTFTDGYCYNTITKAIRIAALPEAPVVSAKGNTTLCRTGDSVVLVSDAANNQWKVTGNIIDGATGNTYIARNGGVYWVETANSYGCKSNSNPISISFTNPPANSSITGTTKLCTGNTSQLANATSGGTWSISDKTVATIDSTGKVTAAATGTAVVTYTTHNSYCSTPVTATISVGTKPAIPAITGNKQACINATTQLSNTLNGGTWNSSDNSIATISTTGVATALKAGSATITYSVSNDYCSNATTAQLTVNALPAVPVITVNGNTSFCPGDSAVLSTTTAQSYQWQKNGTAVTGATTASFTAGSAGAYTVAVTNAAGCTATSVATQVTLLDTPQVNVTADGPLNLCEGKMLILASAATTGNQWLKDNVVIPGATGAVYSTSTAGSYSLQVTGNNGCKATSNAYVISLKPVPVIDITSSAGSSITKGSSTRLTVTSDLAIGSVIWTPATSLDFPTSATPVASPQTSTTYTATVTSVEGCSASASTTINVAEQFSGRIIITPNGDGINDKFTIDNVSGYADNQLRIFDRSGKLVYDKHNYDNSWGGTSGQTLLAADTYFFVFSSQGKTIKKGSVTVVR